MSRQQFKVQDVLRLEIQEDWPDLPNQILNPSGAGGAWGWETVGASETDPWARLTSNGERLQLLTTEVVDGSWIGCQWRIDIPEVTATGQQVRAVVDVVSLVDADPAGAWRITFVEEGGGSYEEFPDPLDVGLNELPPTDIPVGTTALILSHFTSLDLTPAGYTVRFKDAWLVYGEAAAVAASDPLSEPDWVDVIGPTSEVTIERDELSVGILTATIYDSTLDPASTDLIRPGKRCRAMTLIDGEWEYLFTGKLDNPSTAYELHDPNLSDLRRTQIRIQASDATADLAQQPRPNGVATIDELPAVLIGTGVPWNVNGSTDAIDPTIVPIVSVNDSAFAVDQVAMTRDSVLGYAWVDRTGVLQAWDRSALNATGPPDTIRWRPIATVPGISPAWSTDWDGPAAGTTYRRTLDTAVGASRFMPSTLVGADQADVPIDWYMQQIIAVDDLPVGPLAGEFRSVWSSSVIFTSASPSRYLRVIARVFNGAGTVERGVVFDGNSAQVSTTSEVTRTVGGPLLEGVTVQSGDILVVEVGGHVGTYSHSSDHAVELNGYSASVSHPDMPYSDGALGATASAWVELELVTPSVPTSVLDDTDYSDAKVDFDVERCFNTVNVIVVRINPGTGATEEVTYGPFTDAESVRQWRARVADFRVHGIDEDAVEDFAAEILATNSTPVKRLNTLTLPLRTIDELEEHALVDLYDLIDVSNDRAEISNQLSRVTSVKHRIYGTTDGGRWLVDLDFSTDGNVAAPQVTPSPTLSGSRTTSQLLRPVGEVTMWYGAKADIPAGWLPLDGTTFDGDAYPDLADLLGGTTLPDFEDRFPIGAGSKALGTSGGSVVTSDPVDTAVGWAVTDSGGSNAPRLSEHNDHTHNATPPWRALWFIVRAA